MVLIMILLILSVLVGVLMGKVLGERRNMAKGLLVLSAGFLITLCLNEVFPMVYESHAKDMGVWVLVGVLLQLVLENLTKGFEHGHMHHHSEQGILPVALIVGLFIHAFIEGIPLARLSEWNSPYLQGILVHNLPISFVLGAFLFKNKKFSPFSWLVIVLFALASPLGMLLGQYFPSAWEPYFLAIVGGIFLHISSVIIFESSKNHNIDWGKIALVILGVALALSTHQFHHH